MKTLRSYLGDKWVEGSGAPQTLVNPATEEALAQVSSEGLDLAAQPAVVAVMPAPLFDADLRIEAGANQFNDRYSSRNPVERFVGRICPGLPG